MEVQKRKLTEEDWEKIKTTADRIFSKKVANSAKKKAYMREYYKANKEKLNAYTREYYKANKEKISAHKREHYKVNKSETTKNIIKE